MVWAGQTCRHQPRKQPRQRNPAPVLVVEDEAARGIIVEGRRVHWHWPPAIKPGCRSLAAALARNVKQAPAINAQAILIGERGTAQRAARRIDEIHQRLHALGEVCDHCHLKQVSHGLHCGGKRGRATRMNAPAIPAIFSPARRAMRLRRAQKRQMQPDAARFLAEDMIEDTLERLAFLRHQPARALVLGDWTGELALRLTSGGTAAESAADIDLEAPFLHTGFDLITVIGLLDAVNDLPGALIHLRNALAPGGLVITHFIGGQSLPALRAAMMAAEPDRPAARIHPLVDPRAAPGLLQRAGWKDPVVDTHLLTVRYSTLDRLVADLRDCGLGNALAKPAAPLGKAALARARAAFAARAEPDGKTAESFDIITLTGRRSLAGT